MKEEGEVGCVRVDEEENRRLGRIERRAAEVETEVEVMARRRDNPIAGEREKGLMKMEMWMKLWGFEGFNR